jgi:Na+/H+ antiporter NhaD/arsenite permease-like protein
MAILVGRKADAWGRKPLFIAGFVILPIRGFLYTLSDNPYWLVGVQLLGGMGAGLYGALFPLIVADLMEGTGRFNVAQGAVITAQESGASLSTTMAGPTARRRPDFVCRSNARDLGCALCAHQCGRRGYPHADGHVTSLLPIAAAIIFTGTYLGVALGRVPGLRLDRAGITLVGAVLMVAVGALTPAEAYAAVDLSTIVLLLGMMIVVAHLKLSGFFRLVASWALRHAHSPLVLLGAVCTITGVLSAFLVNDAICLVVTPLAIEVTRALKRNPVPYLLAVAMSSNVGSTATITGNPQNMIIGTASRIPYTAFAAALAPIAVVSLILVAVIIGSLWWTEFARPSRFTVGPETVRTHKRQMVKSVVVAFMVIASFFLGVPVAEAAILGGAFLLITRAVKAVKVYREIDGSLLIMFAGLFVVVAGAEKVLLTPDIMNAVRGFHLDDVWVLTAVTALLSNIISNVPAVLALKPFVQSLSDQHQIWLVIAMSSTLAGNLTLVGSVANLIVAERARSAGIAVSFGIYCLAGVPVTLLSLLFGAWWLR